MPMMNSQESDPGGVAVLCWAGEVGDKRQVTIASGRQLLGRCWAQILPSAARRWPAAQGSCFLICVSGYIVRTGP